MKVTIYILLMGLIGYFFARYDYKWIKNSDRPIDRSGYQIRNLIKFMLIFCLSIALVGATTEWDIVILWYVLVTIGGLLLMDTVFILLLNYYRGLKPWYLGKGSYDTKIKKYIDAQDFMIFKLIASAITITLLYIFI